MQHLKHSLIEYHKMGTPKFFIDRLDIPEHEKHALYERTLLEAKNKESKSNPYNPEKPVKKTKPSQVKKEEELKKEE